MNWTSTHTRKYNEDRCAICLESFSQESDHEPSALECGHVFGRSCVLKWEERDPSCPMCRQPLFLLEEAPANGLITELRYEFRKFLSDRRINALALPFLTTFLLNPSHLSELMLFVNTASIAAGCVLYAATKVCSAIDRLRPGFFGSPSPALVVRPPRWQQAAAVVIIPCLMFTTSVLCARLARSSLGWQTDPYHRSR